MSSKRALYFLVVATFAVSTGVLILRAEEADGTRPGNTAIFMRAKLVSSQRVMEGLVTENSALIRRGALEMKNMSEHAEWPRSRDEVYEHYSESFRRQCNKLADLAKKQDQVAAHFTFLNITTTCIDCHNYVRGSFRVARDASNPSGPVHLIPAEWDDSKFEGDLRSQVPSK